MIQPNYDEALNALRSLYPHGPWLLTALPVERGAGQFTSSRTYYPATEDQARAWLEQHSNGGHNIYFSVNPPMREMEKKAERIDIKAMHYLHIDLDPRAGEDVTAERSRILRLLTTELPAGVPPPTAIFDSGGGYWGFWRLNDPFEIDGNEERYEDAKLFNLQLELLFRADSCHNVDRIARLPGTVNYPDKRKLKKGRTVALATVLSVTDKTYSLATFTKAPQVQTTSGFSSGNTVVISENVRRIDSLDELPQHIPPKTKVCIAMGHDPDDPDLGNYAKEGRSGPLFYVCCEMVRAGVDDDTIYSIITDPDWAISSSVLDGSNGRPERYARRQIERARDFAVDPKLAGFNDKYAVVQNAGNGRCRVVYEDEEGALVTQSPTDFKTFYSNEFVTVPNASGNGTAEKPVGAWWFSHRQRRSYQRIVFLPGSEVPRNVYNMWRGFAFEAIPGGTCDRYLRHIRECICANNQEAYEYVLNWMARAVQVPNEPGHTAIVLRGKQGVGKGSYSKVFCRLFGRHGKQITDPKHLVGSFNAHLRDCVALFADEAVTADNKHHEATLKALVTEESLMVEAKGVDAAVEKNYLHVIMASNEDWVVPMGVDDRRFVVLDVSREHMQDRAYFEAMKRELESGGYSALLHLLLTRDITKFDVSKRPMTAGHREQKIMSFNPLQRWWYDVLMNGVIMEAFLTKGCLLALTNVVWDYNNTRPKQNQIDPSRMRSFLEKALQGSLDSRQLTHKESKDGALRGEVVSWKDGRLSTVERPQVIELPPLAVLRGKFDEEFGGPYSWTEEPDISERVEAF